MASKTELEELRILKHAKHKRAVKLKVYATPFDAEADSKENNEDLQEVATRESIPGGRSDSFVIPNYPKTDEEFTFLKTNLQSNFVFRDLSDDEMDRMIMAFEKYEVKANTIIIRYGDTTAEYFYVLQSGILKIEYEQDKDKEVLRVEDSGAAFGELSLMYNTPREGTCQAIQDSVLWRLNQAAFRRVLSRYAIQQEQSASDLRQCSPLFASVTDSATLTELSNLFTTVKFQMDERIITKGDQGELFYVIREGTVRVSDIGTGTSAMVDQTLTAGDWFGELEARTGEPRIANVTAATEIVVTLAMSKDDFQSAVVGPLHPMLIREGRKRFLRALPIFANSNSAFTDTELLLLVDKLQEKSFEAGDVVVDGAAKAEAQRSFWLVRQGNVDLFDGNITHHLQRGDYFGDKWLNEAARRPDHTSISAKTAKATCVEDTSFFVLDCDDIEEVIGDVARLGASMPYHYPGLDTSIQLEDIQKHRILGQGEFAVVYLASHKMTKKSYALKTLSKLHLLEHTTNAIAATKHEKEIMSSVHHPFIMGMHASFQDTRYVYLLLPLFQGGELFGLIYKEDSPTYGLTTADAVFYSACIVEALGHLHSRNIIYRDLKPDNVMIDSEGYAVLIDMGLAKFVVGKTYSMVGTPAYIASEVLLGRGHNKAVDYWALGCVLYEMLDGVTPFYWEGATQKDEFEAILRCDYKCPDSFSEDAKDLINKLLVLDPTQRLGASGMKGHLDIMSHPWFNCINFKKLRKKEIASPWIPKLKDSMDVSNFAEYDDNDIRPPDRELSDDEQLLFQGF